MYINTLNIVNYKNIAQAAYQFSAKINCFVGQNGVGKTNILDSIFHLAHGKSYFNPQSVQNILHGTDFFLIESVLVKNDKTEHITCSYKRNLKKIIKRNQKTLSKISDHFGFIPVVLISPADQDLIAEGSEMRRKFIDLIISQQDAHYLHILIRYQKILEQRNALLKYFATHQVFNPDQLEIYTDILADLATQIYTIRKHFLAEFIPIFSTFYQQIAQQKEKVTIEYHSLLHQYTAVEGFQNSVEKDRMTTHTTFGIHKDDLLFFINDFPVKKMGSQGQQKTFLIALKLAHFEFVKQKSGIAPIVLFDDIFDKLDAIRIQQIILLLMSNHFGQIFITDTHKARTQELLQNITPDYEIFEIK